MMRMALGSFCLLVGASLTFGADLKSLVLDLRSKDADLRRQAAQQLGDLGAEAKPAVPYLVRAMKDKDVYVRRFATQSLGKIGPAKGAVEALAAAMKDENRRVVEAAAISLGSMGKAGIKPLGAIIQNKKLDGATRRRAVESLGRAGQGEKAAVDLLIEALKDSNVRLPAVQALGNLGAKGKPALETLKTMMEDRRIRRDRTFAQAARQTMRKLQRAKD